MDQDSLETLTDDLAEELIEKVMDNDALEDVEKKAVLEGITDALQFRTQHWGN